jgi:death on curing protein
MTEPRWLLRAVVEVLHDEQLAQHGGLAGIRDEGALESALGRPRNRWAYVEGVDLADLGAAYAYGIATSHPFNDGNKRTAFVAMMVFLERNEWALRVTDEEVVTTFLALAAGDLDESSLAVWIRGRLRRRRRTSR